MPRSIIVVIVAVALLGAACGGDEDATEEPGDAPTGVSEVDVGEAEQPDSTTPDNTAEPTERADAAPEPGPQPVRLGDRFPWCADAQVTWDYRAETHAQLEAAETTLHKAQSAFDAATDDLDRAEAQQALEAAEAAHADAALRVQGANRSIAWLLDPDRDLSDDTEAIAVQRAEAAWRASSDPALVELHDFILDLDAVEAEPDATMEAPPESESESLLEPEELRGWTPEEVIAALGQVQSNIDAAAQVIVSLLWDLDASIAAIRDADSPEAALAAYRRSINTAHSLKTEAPRFDAAYWDWTVRAPSGIWADERVQAAHRDIRNPDVHEAIPAWVVEVGVNVYTSEYARYGSSVGRNRADDAAKGAAATFMVADTSGMAAFQASVSASCEQ